MQQTTRQSWTDVFRFAGRKRKQETIPEKRPKADAKQAPKKKTDTRKMALELILLEKRGDWQRTIQELRFNEACNRVHLTTAFVNNKTADVKDVREFEDTCLGKVLMRAVLSARYERENIRKKAAERKTKESASANESLTYEEKVTKFIEERRKDGQAERPAPGTYRERKNKYTYSLILQRTVRRNEWKDLATYRKSERKSAEKELAERKSRTHMNYRIIERRIPNQ